MTAPGNGSGHGPGRRVRVLLVTEGTYPYVVGGVSTWCDLLLRGLPDVEWSVCALSGPDVDTPAFRLPENATLAASVRLWDTHAYSRLKFRRERERGANPDLAAALVRGLVGWDGDTTEVADALVWCALHPAGVDRTFRSREAWNRYLDALRDALSARPEGVGHQPDLDMTTAIGLYRTLSWVARTAAVPVPETDVSLVTAAGWACIPAVVAKALSGTPVLLSEHGVYVREAYLAAVRSSDTPAQRFVATRLARGLTRLAYSVADLVTPVADANRAWEEALGVPPEHVLTIPNGVPTPAEPSAAPRTRTVVSVGRLDPLKDVSTMLRVAAAVRRRVPDATFLHYGPVPGGQEAYARSCRALHDELRLGSYFRFEGPTTDPTGVMRDADVVLMTSISEGFPMSVLEALSQGRPVVTTLVGGVLDAMRGAGVTAPAGDVYGLADGVAALLEDPELAEELGMRGHARVSRLFSEDRCLGEYRRVLHGLAAGSRVARRASGTAQRASSGTAA
ncbi:MAG: GT4 family glycosyltransferase PelF [Actinomycetes bacterium]